MRRRLKIVEEELNELTIENIVEDWLMDRRVDDSAGVKNLAEFCEALGYDGTYATSGNDYVITRFLADNPGAVEALYRWIADQYNNDTDAISMLTEALYEIEAEDEE